MMQKTVMELVEENKADFVNVNAGVFDWERKYGKDFKKYFDNDRETLIDELENIMLGSFDNDSKRCAFEVYQLIYRIDKNMTERVRHIVRKIIDMEPSRFRREAVLFLDELCKNSNDDLLLYAYKHESQVARKDIIGLMIMEKNFNERFLETESKIYKSVLRQFFMFNIKDDIKVRGMDFLVNIVKESGVDLTVNIIKTILESEYISEKKLNLIRLAVQEVPEVWSLYEKEIENGG